MLDMPHIAPKLTARQQQILELIQTAIARTGSPPTRAEIASELRIPLHRKGWSGVLADATLRSDQIHANAAGYERFAQGLVETLRATGLLAGA